MYKRLFWPIPILTNNLSRKKKLHLKVFLNRFMLIPVKIYLFKFYSRNTRRRCETSSKLTIKTPEWRHWRCSGVFLVNFEHISHLYLVFLYCWLWTSPVCWLSSSPRKKLLIPRRQCFFQNLYSRSRKEGRCRGTVKNLQNWMGT